MTTRIDGRTAEQVRPVSLSYNSFGFADGSVLYCIGNTKVLVSVTLSDRVPPFLRHTGTGWLTAEYAMLPAATRTRTKREATATSRNARSVEISRLIGRCFRSVCDLSVLGERTVTLDCDVLQADGGTRTACITAASYALQEAEAQWRAQKIITKPFLSEPIAALSSGITRDGTLLVDLSHDEDVAIHSDFNFVITQSGLLVEVQGTAEQAPLSWTTFDRLKEETCTAIASLFDR